MVFILIPSLPWPDCKLFNIDVSILMNIRAGQFHVSFRKEVLRKNIKLPSNV